MNTLFTAADLKERVSLLEDCVQTLRANRDKLVDSIVEDGWPRAMALEGMMRHLETWQPDLISAAMARELAGVGDFRHDRPEFDGWLGQNGLAIRPIERAVHLWPALPGAGVTPFLFGVLTGATQWIRPSSRGTHFARAFVETLENETGFDQIKYLEPGAEWEFASLVVVSGSDETVRAVRAGVASDNETRVLGYGHGVSFGFVDDTDALDLERLAASFATDAVLWHQKGCFSLRGLVFKGEPYRLRKFGALLGEAIEKEEKTLQATEPPTSALASRVQRKNLVDFRGIETFGNGLGWVQIERDQIGGKDAGLHVVPCVRVDEVSQVPDVLDVEPRHFQGAALSAPETRRENWHQQLGKTGATRICVPGKLQQPSGAWPHDGRLNTPAWFDTVFVEQPDEQSFLASDQ